MSQWSRALKAALVNEDEAAVMALYATMPERYETLEQAQEAQALMAEAIVLLRQRRTHLEQQMEQTKAAISYQRQQGAGDAMRLDIKE